MIDLSKISYRIVAVDESGKQYDIKNFVINLGWEENPNEIAVRLSFKVRNDNTAKGYLSSLIRPGCLIVIFATDGRSINQEVARGYVEKWNPKEQNSSRELSCTAYDELYRLQKSQENMYFPSGTGTQAAISRILEEWGISTGEVYGGPNAAHGKLKYNNKYLSDIILDLLDDAAKKGEAKCLIRSAGGITGIIPRGSNETVYVFRADNTKVVSESLSTADIITRVKVIGQANDEGKSSVEATLNGLTQYGVRQRVYSRGADESMADAQSAAQEILDSKGIIAREVSVQSPDVPFIRKGDLVYLMAGISQGYYYVAGIRHDADTLSMTMDLETAEQMAVSEQAAEVKREYSVGDVVQFCGGMHYISSGSDAKGSPAGAGPAKITRKGNPGKSHPWHLIHEDGSSNVYGWVDDGTFE